MRIRQILLAAFATMTGMCAHAGAPDFIIGKIENTDTRILDVSGTYTLAGGFAVVRMQVVQDDRGKLLAVATVHPDADTTIGPIIATGKLYLTRGEKVKLKLAGKTASSAGPRTSLDVKGSFDGTNFNVEVDADGPGGFDTFEAVFPPEDPQRGYILSDGQTYIANSSTLVSTRTLDLPWGDFEADARQYTRGVTTKFKAWERPTFQLEYMANETPKSTTSPLRLRLNKVRLGYGTLRLGETGTILSETTSQPRRLIRP